MSQVSLTFMVKKPFRVNGKIPDPLQDEIRRRMESEIPSQFRRKREQGNIIAGQILSRKMSEERKADSEIVIPMYKSGASLTEIAKEIGRSRHYIKRILAEFKP